MGSLTTHMKGKLSAGASRLRRERDIRERRGGWTGNTEGKDRAWDVAEPRSRWYSWVRSHADTLTQTHTHTQMLRAALPTTRTHNGVIPVIDRRDCSSPPVLGEMGAFRSSLQLCPARLPQLKDAAEETPQVTFILILLWKGRRGARGPTTRDI